MTIKETLNKVADDLGKIMVPAELANDIARPIWDALRTLRQCAEMIKSENEAEPENEKEVAADV